MCAHWTTGVVIELLCSYCSYWTNEKALSDSGSDKSRDRITNALDVA